MKPDPSCEHVRFWRAGAALQKAAQDAVVVDEHAVANGGAGIGESAASPIGMAAVGEGEAIHQGGRAFCVAAADAGFGAGAAPLPDGLELPLLRAVRRRRMRPGLRSCGAGRRSSSSDGPLKSESSVSESSVS